MDIETCPVVRFHAETLPPADEWPEGDPPDPTSETWDGYADPDDADEPDDYYLVVADTIAEQTGRGEPSSWPLPPAADCDRVWWCWHGETDYRTGETRRVSAHRGEGIPVVTWGRALRHLAARQCPRALR
jgi:hypothetical protein